MYLSETFKKHDTKKLILLLAILMTIVSVNLVWGVPADSITVKAKHVEVESNSIYQVYFSIDQEIPPKAIIVVTFPESFDLSGVSIAGSTTINGGFGISVDNSKVIIKRSGLGKTVKPNEKVDVKFANVKNPNTADDNYKIKVEIKNENETTIIEKEETIKIVSLPQNK
jgi:hypothetical protein